MSTKNSNDTIGNRTHDIPACSAVPQRTVSLTTNYVIKISTGHLLRYVTLSTKCRQKFVEQNNIAKYLSVPRCMTAGNPHREEPAVWSSSPERSSVAITEGSCGFSELVSSKWDSSWRYETNRAMDIVYDSMFINHHATGEDTDSDRVTN